MRDALAVVAAALAVAGAVVGAGPLGELVADHPAAFVVALSVTGAAIPATLYAYARRLHP